MGADGGGAACVDGLSLLQLALLEPPPPAAAAELAALEGGDGGDGGGVGATLLAAAAAATAPRAARRGGGGGVGARVEVFCRHWVALGWPLGVLVGALCARLGVAAPALCWMMRHRAAVVDELARVAAAAGGSRARRRELPALLVSAVRLGWRVPDAALAVDDETRRACARCRRGRRGTREYVET